MPTSDNVPRAHYGVIVFRHNYIETATIRREITWIIEEKQNIDQSSQDNPTRENDAHDCACSAGKLCWGRTGS